MIVIKNKISENSLVLKPIGKIDVTNSIEFLNKVNSSLKEGIEFVTLDFEEIMFVSSTGLRALLEMQKGLNNAQISLKIINVTPSVAGILKLTGFDNIFTIEKW